VATLVVLVVSVAIQTAAMFARFEGPSTSGRPHIRFGPDATCEQDPPSPP
jgi:hypothetical protein